MFKQAVASSKDRQARIQAEAGTEAERLARIQAEIRIEVARSIKAKVNSEAHNFDIMCLSTHGVIDDIVRRLVVLGMLGNGISSYDLTSSFRTSTSHLSHHHRTSDDDFSELSTSLQNEEGIFHDFPAQEDDGTSIFKLFLTCVDETPLFVTKVMVENNPNLHNLQWFQNYLDEIVRRGDFPKVKKATSKEEKAAIAKADTDCTKILCEAFLEGVEAADFAFPSFQSTQVAVSHKLLRAILSRIGIFQGSEVHISHEQSTAVVGTAPAIRSPDFMVRHVTEVLSQALRFSHVVPIESNALRQRSSRPDSFRKEATMQVIRHLAKSVSSAFYFGGIGIDCTVHGAILTMVSVEIVEIQLEHAGTSKARLLLRRSGSYPLFSMEFFKEKTPLDGFRILAGLLSPTDRVSPFSLVHCWYNDDESGPSKTKLVQLLGTGTFSNVYELSCSPSAYLKVPKDSSFAYGLRHELLALRRLDNEHIPKALSGDLGKLRIQVRCEASVLDCLRLEGDVGIAASKFEFTAASQVLDVSNQVKKRLLTLMVKRLRTWMSALQISSYRFDNKI